MVTTFTPSPRTNGHRSAAERAEPTRRQATARDRGRIAAGVLAIGLAGLLAVLVYGSVGQRQPVLAVARTVDPGQVLTDADLTVVRVAVDRGVLTVPSAERASIVGRRAAVRLLPGMLLSPEATTTGSGIADGSAVVGAIVKPGQYPLGLRAGDRVQVLVVGGPAGDRPVDATIVAVSPSGGSTGTAISLAVPEDTAARLASAGAEGRLLLMVPAP